MPAGWLRQLAEHWRTSYDWRGWEERLAELPQFVVVHWTELERGGHFTAMEAPDLLVDVRTFFRALAS